MTRIKFRFLVSLAAVAGLLSIAQAGAQEGPQKLPAIRINAGMHIIQAEVAQSTMERSIGLMNRPSMGSNEGMLLPLSIAFLADDGTVVNLDDMKPQTLDSHCSSRPVRFVLEMNQGWFAKRGVKPGSKLTGAPFGN